MSTVEIARLHWPVTNLGPGRRIGVWFQGCDIGCSGCMATDTWPEQGNEWKVDSLVQRVETIREAASLSGLTISGGEPFNQPEALAAIITNLRLKNPDFDILVYSGYTWTQLHRRLGPVAELPDAVVAGPFVGSRPDDSHWRGSSNQTLHVNTELGERILAPWIHDQAAERIQVKLEGGLLWALGIPRAEELARFSEKLTERGVSITNASWKP